MISIQQYKTPVLPLLLFLFALLLTACNSEQSDTNNPPQRPGGPFGGGMMGGGQLTSVEVLPVTTSSISDLIRSYGTISAKDIVNVNPQVSNRVTEILVDLGDSVRTGQVMARIYNVPFRDALEEARAQVDQNRNTFERDSVQFQRQQILYDQGAISATVYEDARTQYENSRSQFRAAQASLTQSRENLENTEIKAPVNGVVLNRLISVGDIATTGSAAFEVANLSGYEVRLFLPLQDWEAVETGQQVNLRLSNRDGLAGRGTVTRISPQLNPSTGLGEVVVTLTERTSSIRQGVLVESNVILTTKDGAVVIPRSALIERVETYIEPETNTVELRREYSVFVAQGDTVATQRDLELGIEQGDQIEVLSGLEPGDQLIITGHRNLQNRARIRISQPLDRGNNVQSIDSE